MLKCEKYLQQGQVNITDEKTTRKVEEEIHKRVEEALHMDEVKSKLERIIQ